MIRAIIFYYDDTLVETRLIKFEHHRTVAKKFYDIDISEETFLEHYGKPFNILLNELYKGKDTLENMVKANRSVQEQFLKKIYPDTKETINKLFNQGLKLGILTATNKNFVLEDLERHGIPSDHFALIQGPEETEVHKPDPAVFLPMLAKTKEWGIKKEEIVYIGDSVRDLKAAVGAGLHFIAVTTGVHDEKEWKSLGADRVMKNISDLPALVEKL